MSYYCHNCKNKITEDSLKPTRYDTCHYCGVDLRCCLNCSFYDLAHYNECKEPQAERVLDKEKANFCDYFKFKEGLNKDKNLQKENTFKKLEDLFK